MTIREVCRKYLDTQAKHFAEETRIEREFVLKKLCDAIGDKDIAECQPIDLLQFLEAQTTWKAQTTRCGRTFRILAAFTWSASVGLIESNPFLRGKKLPYKTFIGGPDADVGFVAVSDDDFMTLMDHCKQIRLKRAILFLRYTGCRPIEMRRIVWSQINDTEGVIVQKEHKTAKKTGKPRILHVSDEVADLIRAIKFEQGTTPHEYVFVNQRNNRWSRQALNGAVRRVALRAGLGYVTPYGLGRVAFIERGILAGVNGKALAELVGHTDSTMIDTVYARRIGDYGTQLKGIASQVLNAPLMRRAI